jgi:hypothetical protein
MIFATGLWTTDSSNQIEQPTISALWSANLIAQSQDSTNSVEKLDLKDGVDDGAPGKLGFLSCGFRFERRVLAALCFKRSSILTFHSLASTTLPFFVNSAQLPPTGTRLGHHIVPAVASGPASGCA